MRIQLDPNWAIDWDGQCATLIRFSVITGEGKGAKMTKAENIGKLRESNAGYYGADLRNILGAYVNKAALEGDGTCDLTALLAKLDQIEKVIKALPLKLSDLPAEQEQPKPTTLKPEPVAAPAAQASSLLEL